MWPPYTGLEFKKNHRKSSLRQLGTLNFDLGIRKQKRSIFNF